MGITIEQVNKGIEDLLKQKADLEAKLKDVTAEIKKQNKIKAILEEK